MRFTIQKENLLTALQRLISIVERRQLFPVLANILLVIQNDRIFFTASNMELELTENLLLENYYEEGSVTIPAHKFLDITRVMAAGAMIEVEIEENKAIISCEKSRFVLQTLPAEQFPKAKSNKADVEFTISQNIFYQLIHKVYFSMSEQDVRFYLNGMLLEITNKMIRTATSDGHRLSMAMHPYSDNIAQSRIIIPRKTTLELLKLLNTNDEGSITVSLGDNLLRITGDNYDLTSKLIDTKCPNYETLIPKTGRRAMLIKVDSFKQVLRRIAVLSNEKFHGATFVIQTDKLIVTTRNNDNEEAKEELEMEYAGENFEISFNISYFMDVLDCLTAEKVKLTFSDDSSSLLLQVPEDESALYVIMPMRLI
jgi:DNA polymerase-3 subunit beta